MSEKVTQGGHDPAAADGGAEREAEETSIVGRLRARAAIRRTIKHRKSVQEGKPDRISDLLEEAAESISQLERELGEARREVEKQMAESKELVEQVIPGLVKELGEARNNVVKYGHERDRERAEADSLRERVSVAKAALEEWERREQELEGNLIWEPECRKQLRDALQGAAPSEGGSENV